MKKNAMIIAIGLALVLTACANTAVNTVTDDEVTSEVAEAAKGDTIEDTSSATASTEEATEASTEASSEEVVEAVIETSTENTDTTVVEATVTEADVTESVQVSTSTSSTLTGQTGPNGWPNAEGGYIPNNTHGWPVISGYVGIGEGPGAAWRADFNYRDNTEVSNHTASANDPNSNAWDWVTIVTASNGVKVKCFEMTNGYLIINDGAGKDLEPNSKWMAALREIEAGGDTETINYWNSSSGATLPTTSFKRTSIDTGDANIVAFKQTFEDYAKQITADAQLVTNANGFQFINANYNTLWSITYDGSEWVVKINVRPATRSWEAMKEIMHYVNPEGNSVYQLIYEDFYTGRQDIMPTYDDWYTYGGNQVLRNDSPKGTCIYYFK